MILERYAEQYEQILEKQKFVEVGTAGDLGYEALKIKINECVGKIHNLGQPMDTEAIGGHEKIQRLLDRMAAVGAHSLVTVERVKDSAFSTAGVNEKPAKARAVAVEKTYRPGENGGAVTA